jgi:hypothetical protein
MQPCVFSNADAEAGESQAWLDFALRCGYLSQEDYADLDQRYEIICGNLVRMMTEPEKWCGPTQLRETAPEYIAGE